MIASAINSMKYGTSTGDSFDNYAATAFNLHAGVPVGIIYARLRRTTADSNTDLCRIPTWLRDGGDGYRRFPRRQRHPPDVVRFERERRAKLAAAMRRAKGDNGRRRRIRKAMGKR